MFRLSQARAAGLDRAALRRLARSDDWVSIHPGVLCDAQLWRSLDEDPSGRHALQVQPARLCLESPSWASHESAAFVHGLLLPEPPAKVTLTARPGRRSWRSYPATTIRVAPVPSSHLTRVRALPATTVARTLVDLARSLDLADSVVAIDAALHDRRTDQAELSSVLADCRGWPRTRRATRALFLADGRRESPLESRSFLFFHDMDLPLPTPQAWIEDEEGYPFARVDMLWRDRGVIGECDGAVKYAADVPPTTLLAEKRRQERLEDLGYVVVRWDHHDITRARTTTQQRILRAFARADLQRRASAG
jgi:hypothetical protein